MKKEAVRKPRKKKRIYFQAYGKSIIVPFGEYYKQGEEFEEFNLSLPQKRVYKQNSGLIVSEVNEILNMDEEIGDIFIYNYMVLKMSIDTGKISDIQSFLMEVNSRMFTEEMRNLVMKRVDLKYDHSSENEVENYKDLSTTFKEKHFKGLYSVTVMGKMIIPLCIQFMHVNPSIKNVNGFLDSVYIELFKIAGIMYDCNLYVKLDMFVQKIVNSTRYSNNTIWDKIGILGTTPESIKTDIMSKILTTVIVKFDYDRNVMHLVTAVIKRNVMDFNLKRKFPFVLYEFSPHDDTGSSDDDSTLSEAEMFDSFNRRTDESLSIMRRTFADDLVRKICIRNNVNLDLKEVYYHYQTLNIHNFQKFCIMQSFAHYFQSPENIFSYNKTMYVKLMLILTQILERVGIPEIIPYIIGHRQAYNHIRAPKALDDMLAKHPLYINLMENKYKHVQGHIQKKNFIKRHIISLINNVYVRNEYNGMNNGDEINSDFEDIIEMILKFFNMVIE